MNQALLFNDDLVEKITNTTYTLTQGTPNYIAGKFDKGLNIIDLIVLSKLETSKSEVRRLIKGNGVKINNQLIADEKLIITRDLFQDSNFKLSLGKKRHIKVELS